MAQTTTETELTVQSSDVIIATEDLISSLDFYNDNKNIKGLILYFLLINLLFNFSIF